MMNNNNRNNDAVNNEANNGNVVNIEAQESGARNNVSFYSM